MKWRCVRIPMNSICITTVNSLFGIWFWQKPNAEDFIKKFMSQSIKNDYFTIS